MPKADFNPPQLKLDICKRQRPTTVGHENTYGRMITLDIHLDGIQRLIFRVCLTTYSCLITLVYTLLLHLQPCGTRTIWDLRPMVSGKYKDDPYQCETMHDDNTAVKRSSLCSKEMEASRVTAARKPWHCLAHPQRAHHSQSFRDKVVLLRVLKQFNGRTGVSCNEMVHERWLAALETAKFNTNFQSVLWPDATKCSLTLHARGRGCISPHPPTTPLYTVLCPLMLSS